MGKNSEKRRLVWFSCGAASACAAKLAVAVSPWSVRVVYCNTLASEHPDNVRFLKDVQEWIGVQIEIISPEKYADVDAVFEGVRYMAGIHGAPCTREMKKIPRQNFQLPDDTHIFGLTADEGKRIELFERNNPDLELEWILQERLMRKQDCLEMIERAGIALPVMYSLGFRNNNCIGCVKATSQSYWEKTRAHFPEIFAKRAEQSRRIGARLVRISGVRSFLDEMPESGATDEQEDIECGPLCVSTVDAQASVTNSHEENTKKENA